MSGSALSPNTSSIIVGFILLVSACLSTSLIERAGRRSLLLIACAGMCMCNCAVGVFCYLQYLQYDVPSFGWIPIAALSIFMTMYGLGMSNGPILVTSEIFSRDVTSVGTAIGFIVCWSASFLVGKGFADLIALLGVHGCFFLLAGSCACTFIFCYILLPETKGRTREDIVNELNSDARKKNKKNVTHIIGTDTVDAAHV